MGEHAQGTQHLLRPSGCCLTVESRTVKPHHKAPRDFQNFETLGSHGVSRVNNLVCWLGREQEVGSTWGTLIPCASLSHCVHLFTSKFYYTLLRFWSCPLQFVYFVQHGPCRKLHNNSFVRETVEWILLKLCSCPQIISFRVQSWFSKYRIRNMMYEWSVSWFRQQQNTGVSGE